MCKIVLIAEATKRDINNIGDIVAIHEDDVELGNGYSGFDIVTVSLTVAEVRAELDKIRPDIKTVIDEITKEEKEYWKEKTEDETEWKELKVKPKYDFKLVLKDFAKKENNIKSIISNLG